MMENKKDCSIQVVNGAEGKSIYINDYRVAGSKPWGGGTTIWEGNCTLQDIISAIGEDVLYDELIERKKLKVGDIVVVSADGEHFGEMGAIIKVNKYRGYNSYDISGIEDRSFLGEELMLFKTNI